MSHIYCQECGFQNPESANYCARCGALLVKDEGGDCLCEPLEQRVAVRRCELADPFHHSRIVDRVGQLARLERPRGRQCDIQVDAHRLRQLALPRIDADLRLEPQIVNEDRVHRCHGYMTADRSDCNNVIDFACALATRRRSAQTDVRNRADRSAAGS